MTDNNKTTIQVTGEELETLSEAADIRFGIERTVPRGTMVRLLAEDYIEAQEREE